MHYVPNTKSSKYNWCDVNDEGDNEGDDNDGIENYNGENDSNVSATDAAGDEIYLVI